MENPERKTGSLSRSLLSLRIPVTCNRQGRCQSVRWIWLSGNGRQYTKSEQQYGKPFSEMHPHQGLALWQHLSFSKGRDVEVWRYLCTGSLRRFFPGTRTRERSGNALSGGYLSPIDSHSLTPYEQYHCP